MLSVLANQTLQRLMNNKEALDALMNIEDFRNLNQYNEIIINKSEAIKKAKKEANDRELTKIEKRELTEEKKNIKVLENKFRRSLLNSQHGFLSLCI